MKQTIEINQSNFETEVLKSNQPVLVDFWAEWCGPCKMLAPMLDEIAKDLDEKALVVGFHFTFPSVGYVEKDGSGYRLVPIAWNPVL